MCECKPLPAPRTGEMLSGSAPAAPPVAQPGGEFGVSGVGRAGGGDEVLYSLAVLVPGTESHQRCPRTGAVAVPGRQ